MEFNHVLLSVYHNFRYLKRVDIKKLVTVLFLFLLFINISFAQETYYVLHTNGIITHNKDTLGFRDKLSPDDEIVFSSTNDFLIVFSNQSGKRIIKPKDTQDTDGQPSLLSYFVNENLFPVTTQISTRGSGKISTTNELTNYFSQPILVINRHKLNIGDLLRNLPKNGKLQVLGEAGFVLKNLTYDNFFLESLDKGTYKLVMLDGDFGYTLPIADIKIIRMDKQEFDERLKFFETVNQKTVSPDELETFIAETYGKISDSDLEILKGM
ncbi:MAG: hypothetical protein ACFHWX_00550 [Bacteroidota bacterium]